MSWCTVRVCEKTIVSNLEGKLMSLNIATRAIVGIYIHMLTVVNLTVSSKCSYSQGNPHLVVVVFQHYIYLHALHTKFGFLHVLCFEWYWLQGPLYVLQREHLKIAQQFFQLVGGSASECGKSVWYTVHSEMQPPMCSGPVGYAIRRWRVIRKQSYDNLPQRQMVYTRRQSCLFVLLLQTHQFI